TLEKTRDAMHLRLKISSPISSLLVRLHWRRRGADGPRGGPTQADLVQAPHSPPLGRRSWARRHYHHPAPRRRRRRRARHISRNVRADWIFSWVRYRERERETAVSGR